MGTKTHKKDGVTSIAKRTFKGKTRTPKQFIAPFRKGFERTASDDWAKKKKGINAKPHVIILNPKFMDPKGEQGESVLTRSDITQKELMDAAKTKVLNWRPQTKIQKDIKAFNLKQFKRTKYNDYILVYNFNHARQIFDHLRSEKLIKGGITDRGHVKAKTRYHAESELDKLGKFEKWGAGSHKGAYLATRAVQKKLREEAAALTPDIEHSWLVKMNREVTSVFGKDSFLAIIPEPAWKNRNKEEERDLKRTFTKIIDAWLKQPEMIEAVLQIAHSKSTEQVLSDKITDLLLGKKVAAYKTKGRKRHKSKKRKIALNEFKTAKPPPLRTSGGQFTSAMNIQAILANRIKEEVADNMGKGGALVYRTGRFAESVSVEKVMQSRQGTLTAFYTYMKAPYQTFERGYAQGTARRDPRKLIAASIREIARETLNHKLQIRTRRV